MSIRSAKVALLANAKQLSQDEIAEGIKQVDLFFAILPLIQLIQGKIDNIIRVNKISVLDKDIDHSSKFADQVNYYLKNKFLGFLLVHEIEVARLAGVVSIQNPESELLQFIKLTSTVEWIEYIFEKYKQLDKRLTQILNGILAHLENLLLRINADLGLINSSFSFTESFIREIELFIGDPHKVCQSVARVVFNSHQIIYKPRTSRNEIEFNHLVEFFNETRFPLYVRAPKTIDRSSYSWMEFIPNTPVSDSKGVDLYFYRMGGALALFYLLGTQDIISDNVIAHGDTPNFIDLECLTSKRIETSKDQQAVIKYLEGIISVGMLPMWGLGDNYRRDVLIGSLHNLSKQEVKRKIWVNKDSANINQQTESIPAGEENAQKHLPIYNSSRIEIDKHTFRAFCKGFEDQYANLIDNRKTLKTFIKKNSLFQKSFVRVIFHHTALYEGLFYNLIFPESLMNLKNQVSIKRILIKNVVGLKSPRTNSKVTNSIIKQLTNGDIPYFYSFANSRSLFSGAGNKIDGTFYSVSPTAQEKILDRLDSLSPEDLQEQLKVIRGSINFYLDYTDQDFDDDHDFAHYFRSNRRPIVPPLEGAKSVADYLMANFSLHESEANWLSKTHSPIDGNYEFSPLTYELYDGLAGLAFFLLYAHKFTGHNPYFEIAEKILYNMKSHFTHRISGGYYGQMNSVQKQNIAFGPFEFPFCTLYLMEHFDSVRPGSFDFSFAKMVLEWFSESLDSNKVFDYLLGQTGALDLLISLSDSYPSLRIDTLIRRVAYHLMDNAQKMAKESVAWQHMDVHTFDSKDSLYLGGFAHGTAAASFVLFRAAAKLKNSKIRNYAKRALNYDRSLFDTTLMGWKDLRMGHENRDNSSWCHGSSGICLSRALISQYENDNQLFHEMDVAMKNILAHKTNDNLCLCHGILGNLEVFLMGSHLLKNDSYFETSQNQINSLMANLKSGNYKVRFGDSKYLELLGLFMGITGLGYFFLRMHDWEKMPSILCLESSQLPHKVMHLKYR